MNEKSRVVVRETEVQAYIDKGYGPAGVDAQAILADTWDTLPEEYRESLQVMEIDAGKHGRLNALPKAYVLESNDRDGYWVQEIEIQKRDEDWVFGATAAGSDVWAVCNVYSSRRECAQGNKEFLLHHAEALRNKADEIDRFLKHMEVT